MSARDPSFHPSIAIVTSIHLDFDSRIWKHAKSVVASGCEVHLICPWELPDGEFLEGVQVHSFPRVHSRRNRPILIPFRVFGKLLPIISKVDIVHFHDIDILPYMALLSIFKHVVYDVHENYADEMLVRDWIPGYLRWPLFWMIKFGQYVASLLIKNIVLVVPAQERDFGSNRLRKIIIYNYASIELLNSPASDYAQRAEIVIFSGSHYLSNGSMLIVEIAARTREVLPNLQFLLANRFANAQLKNDMLLEIDRLGLSNHVHFFPYVKPHEFIHILNTAMIGIAPNSRVPKQEKAIPTKLFEYMAAGLPVVVSNLPYQEHIVITNDSGIVAIAGDPQSFTDAIVKLVRDRAMAKRLGDNGRLAFQKYYSWESQIPSLISFYRGIVGAARR
jgi:glycosyltransferase involved in cell wall biosynthesis